MVAVCLLEREPLRSIDSAKMVWKEEDRATLLELSGESGTITVVEAALPAIAAETAPGQLEDTSAVKLEDYGVTMNCCPFRTNYLSRRRQRLWPVLFSQLFLPNVIVKATTLLVILPLPPPLFSTPSFYWIP